METVKINEKSVQEILSCAYEEKRSRNLRYSLRAFAKHLEIDPSSLSKVMNGKRHLPTSKARDVAEKLFDKERDIVSFYKKVFHEEKDGRKTICRIPVEEYQLTEKDHFKIIADWEYFAILNVITIDGFDHTIPWIARRLGLPLDRTHEVVAHLIQTGLLSHQDGKYVRYQKNLNTTEEVSSKAIQEAHRQILKLASDSLTKFSVDQRGFYTTTVVSNPQKISEAKKMALAFKNRLIKFLESDSDKSEVYQVSINLFPLTSKERN